MGRAKIGAIIGREFNYRVRKRTFILGTILMPLLVVGLAIAPVWMATVKTGGDKVIEVIDRTGQIVSELQSQGTIRFEPTDRPLDEIKTPNRDDIYGILTIDTVANGDPTGLKLYTYGPTSIEVEQTVVRQVRDIVEKEKLRTYAIDNLPQILQQVETPVNVETFRIDEAGDERASSSTLSMGAAYLFGFLIYLFVFMYGAMVMQGVIEEKSSKVLEIVVSSVRPFELMMGKILGIGLVAVVQFLIWAILIVILGMAAMAWFGANTALGATPTEIGNLRGMADLAYVDPQALEALRNMTDPGYVTGVFGGFIAYFIGGYLLYAAMFAAVGSAVDNVQDTQQLQIPITVPLILAIIVLFTVMRDPQSSIAFWFSMIPFTSPVIMMARIPYGVPAWEIALSLALLYGGFIAMVWFAAKIYRVGIFMYGKKPSLREMCRWITYKN